MALDPLSNVVAALARDKIIPDVVPAELNFTPTHLFSVLYAAGGGKEVLLGNEFAKEETEDEPLVSFAPMNMTVQEADSTGEGAGGDPSYTLAMLDPDVPSRANPEFKSFRHWVVTGLKSPAEPSSASTTSSSAALKTQAAITPYRPPGPRPNSGVHRYTFLLFLEPPSGVQIPHDAPEHFNELEQRRSWDVFAFAEKYGLKLVGANFLTLRSPDA
ncbi:PEBP-like protein [Phanerochaete sordida]|uniref:PEBP-like protein n=1 Tax=Phanerochaete sordida TaxID=48140 RepID=A0A9P3GRT1_9APHY|nr:PEBP-like protein [Phanerochaete sordida]